MEMMSRTLVHEHRTHAYTVGTVASGFIGAGGTAAWKWDGEHWQPEGRTNAAHYLGTLTDTELRAKLSPDLTTVLRLGPHWADHGTRRFLTTLDED
jgi:hypothetical protein